MSKQARRVSRALVALVSGAVILAAIVQPALCDEAAKAQDVEKLTGHFVAADAGLMMELLAQAMAPVDEAATEPAEEPAATKPAEEPPATKPAEEPPATRPAEEPPATKPAEEPPATKPAEEPPATKPAPELLRPSTRPRTDLDKAVDEAVRRALEADTQPTTAPVRGEKPPAELIEKLEQEKLTKAWEDFLHYVRIGQVDAAKSFGQALLSSGADPKQIYELSTATEDTHKVLDRGAGHPALKETIAAIRKMIQDGHEKMRTDPAEIRKSIDMLPKSPRAYEIAKRRLIRSGQYALPQIVQRLTDPKIDPLLRERLITILPQMGKDVVLPLSVALQAKDPHLQRTFADALGQIEYPHAGPRLREMVARKDLLKPVHEAAEAALVSCMGRPALKKSVAEICYEIARNYYYHRESLQPDPRWPHANVWYWQDETLIYKPIPRQLFCDIYAMRLSRLALKHDPQFYPAVTLWLAAHINKEVHLAELGEDAKDPIRGADQPPAQFYALAASARFQQDVLAMGLRDFNTPLVLAVMEALVRTNGAKNMVKVHGGAQPLVEAMGYPDRRVRFMAAEALATALPDEPFRGDDTVMSVLIEALRQSSSKKAMIVVKDQDARNALKDAARAAGYEVMENADPVRAIAEVSEAGGVDVFLVNRSPGPEPLLLLLRQKARFLATPVIAAATATEPRKELAERDKRLLLIGTQPTNEQVAKALEDAAKVAAGKPMTPADVDQWAIRAAKAVRLLALTRNEVLKYNRARDALIDCLQLKGKAEIQTVAAEALAVLPAAEAQRAIADLANNKETAEPVRIAAYNALIASVRKYGNQLTEAQSQAVVAEVLGKGSQAIRQAAAQTLSPLDLTSEKIKELILTTEGMD